MIGTAAYGSPLHLSPAPQLFPQPRRHPSKDSTVRLAPCSWLHSSSPPALPANIIHIGASAFDLIRLPPLTHGPATQYPGSGSEYRPDGSPQPEATKS